VDANGLPLPCSMAQQADGIELFIVDRDAHYPVTIDPMVWSPLVQLTGSMANEWAEFGTSLAATADTAIVGAPYEGSPGAEPGAAYVFVRAAQSWTEQQRLTANPASALSLFGAAAGLADDLAIVGAPGDKAAGAKAGAAYGFVRSAQAWDQTGVLAPTSVLGAEFGVAVAIDGATAVIGAPIDSAPGHNGEGAAYVFARSASSWSLEQLLTPADGAKGVEFGRSCSLSGDKVIVGAPKDDNGGTDAGAAYVFTRSAQGWLPDAKLTASDASVNDEFGAAVDIEGQQAAVGAPAPNGGGVGAGACYVFERVGGVWTEQQKLVVATASDGAKLGSSVSLVGDSLLVGAPNESSGAAYAGAAYLFVRSGAAWIEERDLQSIEVAQGDKFGTSAAIVPGARHLMIGSVFEEVAQESRGAVEVFAAGLELGDPCALSTQCVSAYCVEGVCCDAAPCGACYSCRQALTNHPDGICAPLLADTDPHGFCGLNAACDGAGYCRLTAGQPCHGDSSLCASGYCAVTDDICCDVPCANTCMACNASKTGGTHGVCAPIPVGSDPDG
jgi:hypothetical protein